LVRGMSIRELSGMGALEKGLILSVDLYVMELADVLTRVTSSMAMLGLIGIPFLFGADIEIPWLGLLLLIFAPTLGGLLQLALSRTREYDADFDGAALTGDPAGLASALETLERRQGRVWEGFFPAGRVPNPSLLRTHPATQDRIARLNALTGEAEPQIVLGSTRPEPGPSIVPAIRNPRIHWNRMGIWY
jgi:heat shock protein HtpX